DVFRYRRAVPSRGASASRSTLRLAATMQMGEGVRPMRWFDESHGSESRATWHGSPEPWQYVHSPQAACERKRPLAHARSHGLTVAPLRGVPLAHARNRGPTTLASTDISMSRP